MSISTTLNRVAYSGDAVSVAFTFPYLFLANSDLKVYVSGVLQTLTTNYTVTGASNPSGGTVTFVTAPPIGTNSIVILRDPDLLQATQLPPNDPFPAKTVETMIDKLTLQVQRIRDLLNRSFLLPDSDASGASTILPSPAASQLVGWNSLGTALQNYAGTASVLVSTFMATVNSAVNAAAARFLLGAAASGPLASSGITGAAASGANSDITSLSGLTTPLSVLQGGTGTSTGVVTKGFLFGRTMSTAGSSATLSIAAGTVTDSTNTAALTSSAIAKTTAAWALGTAVGGLDTGVIANNTWYHWYDIRRPDTGVVDTIFSTNATTPTLPANYTQYRRIGSAKTNGSAQWVKFVQDGDVFQLDIPVLDVSVTNPGTAAVTRTLSVPLGVRVLANLNVNISDINNSNGAIISDLSITDSAPSATVAPLLQFGSGTNSQYGAPISVMTNTSSQVRSRVLASGVNTALLIATTGWIDTRGRI